MSQPHRERTATIIVIGGRPGGTVGRLSPQPQRLPRCPNQSRRRAYLRRLRCQPCSRRRLATSLGVPAHGHRQRDLRPARPGQARNRSGRAQPDRDPALLRRLRTADGSRHRTPGPGVPRLVRRHRPRGRPAGGDRRRDLAYPRHHQRHRHLGQPASTALPPARTPSPAASCTPATTSPWRSSPANGSGSSAGGHLRAAATRGDLPGGRGLLVHPPRTGVPR